MFYQYRNKTSYPVLLVILGCCIALVVVIIQISVFCSIDKHFPDSMSLVLFFAIAEGQVEIAERT